MQLFENGLRVSLSQESHPQVGLSVKTYNSSLNTLISSAFPS